jgi:CRISPR-associated protein Cas2
MKTTRRLSSYEIMWMIVLFDLPVVEAADRSAASKFRSELLNMGFTMSQYSVYYKLMPGKERAARFRAMVGAAVPDKGRVDILTITDRQYGAIETFRGGTREERKTDSQLVLF